MPEVVPAGNALAIPASPDDVDVMARTIWGEARSEPIEGRTAVAWVIRNRAASGFAGMLSGKDGAVAHVCQAAYQFSCWLESDPNRAKIDALVRDDYADDYDLAQDVLEGIVPDPTGGAVNYYSPSIAAPYWTSSMKFVGRFGSQLFYK